VNFDPYFTEGSTGIYGALAERLVCDDWTMDPANGITSAGVPAKIPERQPAEKPGISGPGDAYRAPAQGHPVSQRPPSNGREFTSADVMFHYHRIYGLGGGSFG